jgi:integrase/recombinase XerD
MPLALLTEWLGHADPETTPIYAHADTEMKRQALSKATGGISTSPPAVQIWHNQEDIIQALWGLTD